MFKKYFNAIYPAYNGRKSIPQDEVVAKIAHDIVQGNSDLIWHAEYHGISVPEPNRSARVESRQRISPNGEWVTVRGSRSFFSQIKNFIRALEEQEFKL